MNILCKYLVVWNLVLINYSTLQILQEIDDITQIIYFKYLIKIKTKNQENFSQEVCLIVHTYIQNYIVYNNVTQLEFVEMFH